MFKIKLKKIIIENFRSYRSRTEIDFDNLTTIIGKNDAGKSTVLEALEIFFNNSLVKIDKEDACVHNTDKKVVIGCLFSDLPQQIILDETANTNLTDEFLLNEDGMLEIHKIYDCEKSSITPEVFISSLYPNEAIDGGKYLIQLTQTELQRKVRTLDIEEGPQDLRSNPIMRKEIFQSIGVDNLSTQLISLAKGNGKNVWDKIKLQLPIYSLFQSDRPSLDGDSEVQDPMKLAVKEALESVESQLEAIKRKVEEKALEVAKDTLEKLREMDPALANELNPKFSEEPKWDKIFKLTLDGDNNIPVNKRGSGARRLILLNFFRAAAERKNEGSRTIIYAIEEPETAQHPSNQMLLADAFLKLSESGNSQIILTTHVPNFASLLPSDSIRFIQNIDRGCKEVIDASQNSDVLKLVAETLGVLPQPIITGVRLAVFVEGPHDVVAIKDLSEIISQVNPLILNLHECTEVIVLPSGGNTLGGWVDNQYLKALGIPEFHLYDRDEKTPPKYLQWCEKIIARNDGSNAFLTNKREMENYIHPQAIKDYFGLDEFEIDVMTDVPKTLATLTEFNQGTIKKKLNNEVIRTLTYEQIKEIDVENEIEGKWLQTITNYFSPVLL